MTTAQGTVAAYLTAQPLAARRVLQTVRDTIQKALPGATESVTYRIPTYKLDGEMVCFFAGHREHYALYPVTARALDEIGAELKAALHGKGTLRFAYDAPVPKRLIARFVKVRASEARARTLARAARKPGKKPAAKTKPSKAPKEPSSRAERAAKGARAR